jgi:DNA-binding NarL/FixJ family response regulator
MNQSIRILLVDDHPVVRTGYRHLLQMDPALEVVAEASDAASAYEAFRTLEPDVVVMDISLPGVSGIEVMKRMRAAKPQARVLIFSMHDEAIFVARAHQAGAAGFLSKSSAPERLLEAVHAIAREGRYAGGPPPQRTATADGGSAAALLNDLSHREAEAFRLWARGLGAEAIGAQLGVSGKTVSNYLSLVRHKLGSQNDVHLMRLAERIWSAD